MRFQIKSVLFVTTTIAILIAWYVDHRWQKQQLRELDQLKVTIEYERVVHKEKAWDYQMRIKGAIREVASLKAVHKKQIAALRQKMKTLEK